MSPHRAAADLDDTEESRRAAARDYLATIPLVDRVLVDFARNVGASPAYQAALSPALRAHADAIERAMVETLVAQYTAPEIRALVSFYASPLGRSVLRKMPAVEAALMRSVAPIYASIDRQVRAAEGHAGDRRAPETSNIRFTGGRTDV